MLKMCPAYPFPLVHLKDRRLSRANILPCGGDETGPGVLDGFEVRIGNVFM